MNVTNYPKAYQSAFREALFVLGNVGAPLGVDISIVSPAVSSAPLGTKRIYATASAAVNVAPYVRGLIDPQPLCDFPAGVAIDSGRIVPCCVSAPGMNSSVVILGGGVEDLPPERILSAAPKHVVICPGERDEISVLSRRIVSPSVVVATGSSELSGSAGMRELSSDNIITVVVEPEQLLASLGFAAAEVSHFSVRLTMRGGTDPARVLERHYTLVPSLATGRRLAWVNRFGAIDYYTFPTVKSIRRSGSLDRLTTPAGTRTVATTAARSEMLVSDPCDEPMADWLAEILSAPSVWEVEGSEARPVNVTGGQVVSSYLRPTCVEIEISDPSYGTVRR